MRVRQSMAVVACLVVLPACTTEPAQDDTEVRGAQVERGDALGQPSDAPTGGADETEAPEQGDELDDVAGPGPRITRRPAAPTPLPSPSDTAAGATGPVSGGAAGSGSGAPARPSAPGPGSPGPGSPGPASPGPGSPGPASPTPQPSESTDTSSNVVERPAPTQPPVEALASGQGWSYVSLLPHEDGSGWTETSATPPQDRSGDSGYRAFTTVATSPVEGAPGQLDVGCRSWIAAGPTAGLRGSGTLTVELRAGDSVLASAVHGVAVDLGPSERDPDLPWGAPVRVEAADGAAVSCTVRVDA